MAIKSQLTILYNSKEVDFLHGEQTPDSFWVYHTEHTVECWILFLFFKQLNKIG